MRSSSLLAWAGAGGVVLALAGIVVAPADAARGWLAAAFLWSGIPVGSLGLLMMMRLIPGKWGHELLLPVEAGSALLPLPALAILPVLIGMGAIYPWVDKAESGFKGAYLTPFFFPGRTLLWFAGLGALAWFLIGRRGSAVRLSAIGLILLPLGGSLIAVDWLLSLDPKFHSSGFGLYALSIQFTVALAFAIFASLTHAPGRTAVLGGLMLTMLLLWGYFLFMPYFIAWSGNLVDVAAWYKRRSDSGWPLVLAAAIALHAIPLLLLILAPVRASGRALKAFAVAVVGGTVLEVGWLVLPEGGAAAGVGSLLYLVAAGGLGCLSVFGYRWMLLRRAAARAPEAA